MCDTIRPVFGETMLAGGGFQSGRTNENAHHDVWFVVLCVVAPEGGQWFFYAAFA